MLTALAAILGACQSEAGHLNRIGKAFDRDWQEVLPPGPAGIPLPTVTGVGRAWALCQATEEKIMNYEPAELAERELAAYQRLLSSLTERRQYLRQLQNDPGAYNLGAHLQSVLSTAPAPAADPWPVVDTLLHQSASFYDQAKKILQSPEYDPTLQAIAQQEQTLSWLEDELPGTLRNAPLDDARINKLEAGITKARFAVKDYLAYCRSLAFEHQDSLLNR